jgi:anti-sigma factor RsiW
MSVSRAPRPDGIPDEMADAIVSYAFDAIAPEEKGEVVAYIAAHPEGQALLDEYREIVGLLPYAAVPSEPPPFLREGVLRTIRAERTRRRFSFSGPSRVIFSIAACLVVSLLVWNIGLQLRVGDSPATPTAVSAPSSMSAISGILSQKGLLTYSMEPQQDAPNASGRVYLTPDLQQAAMAVWHMPQLPPDRTYQLWFRLDDQTRVSVTTFTVDDKGSAVIPLNVPLMARPYVQCGITLEPIGGSPAPTGPRMLTSQVWATPPAYG